MRFTKIIILTAIVLLGLAQTVIGAPLVTSAVAATSDIPAGCPGGPTGPKAPGVTCPSTDVCGTIPDEQCQAILNATPTPDNPLGGLSTLLDWIVNIATGLFVAGAILVIVVSGVQISASAGSPDVIASAKGNILKAVTGLALLISTRAILSVFGIWDAGVAISPPVTLFKNVNTSELSGLQTIIANAITIATWAAGIVSVVFVIVGGVRYIISAGNPNAIKSAKNTILYALVGLIISIMAYGIIDYVIKNLA